MSFGDVKLVPCPGCGAHLDFAFYETDPPPIPPPVGGYQALNGFISEGHGISECPLCGADLDGLDAPGELAA